MRIGWWCYGHYRTDFIAADGHSAARVAIIKSLLERGHEIVWLGSIRKNSVKSPDLTYLNDPGYKTLGKTIDEFRQGGGDTKGWLGDAKSLDYAKELVPGRLDAAVIEMSAMGYQGLLAAKLTRALVDGGTPIKNIYVYDMDNLTSSTRSKFRNAGMDLNEFTVIADFTKRVNQRQGVAFLPYLENLEKKEVDKGNGRIAYVGNDYRRREAMMRFMDNDCFDVYGKYWRNEAAKFTESLNARFHGPIQPREVHDKYAEATLGIQITRQDYKRLGLIPLRLNEVPESGTLIISTDDTMGIRNWLDEKFLFSTPSRVKSLLAWASSLSEEDYRAEVSAQRVKVKKAGTSLNEWTDLIENGAYALSQWVGPDNERKYLL